MPKRVVVLVDSNTLMYVAAGLAPIDSIYEAIGYPSAELATTGHVVDELRKISSRGAGLASKRARAALELIERLGLKVIDVPAYDADESLKAAALKLKEEGVIVYVATSDRELRRSLRMIGVPSIYYRESRGSFEAEWEPL